jgi:voltage-gated potassium channel
MGKLFGGLVMIFGLGMFALPIGILATGFSQEIHRREFVVTWSMISHVPLFANLNAASISRVMANLRAQTYPADARIIAPEDPVNAMYFIAAGEVAIEIEGERHVLEAGEFFGEAGLLREHESKLQSAQAVSNCDLMILDRHDFEHLMREHPSFASQIAAVQRSRRAKPMPDDEDPTE